jgi:small membrane protein
MLIQIILVVAVVVASVLLTRSTANARHQAIRRLLLVGFVLSAVLAILFPEWLTYVANLLDVGRGTDLLLYALVIAFVSFIATSHRRTNQLERKITVLTRELGLAEATLERVDDSVGQLEHDESARTATIDDGVVPTRPRSEP